jgi:hypothetical protein
MLHLVAVPVAAVAVEEEGVVDFAAVLRTRFAEEIKADPAKAAALFAQVLDGFADEREAHEFEVARSAALEASARDWACVAVDVAFALDVDLTGDAGDVARRMTAQVQQLQANAAWLSKQLDEAKALLAAVAATAG